VGVSEEEEEEEEEEISRQRPWQQRQVHVFLDESFFVPVRVREEKSHWRYLPR
jgi:hypothetical protein